MKVICIHSGKHQNKSGSIGDASAYLKEGNTYNVIDIVENSFGDVGYILLEIRSPSKLGSFAAERFIPCSGINEETILINKNKIQTT